MLCGVRCSSVYGRLQCSVQQCIISLFLCSPTYLPQLPQLPTYLPKLPKLPTYLPKLPKLPTYLPKIPNCEIPQCSAVGCKLVECRDAKGVCEWSYPSHQTRCNVNFLALHCTVTQYTALHCYTIHCTALLHNALHCCVKTVHCISDCTFSIT